MAAIGTPSSNCF